MWWIWAILEETKKLPIKLPNKPLSDTDLLRSVKQLKIPNFRGVFMRDTLPTSGPRWRECAILNLDLKKNEGTHWVAYRKNGNTVEYFDSFGHLKPPKELVRYLDGFKIIYNSERFQNYNEINCGHLCLQFLYKGGNIH